MLVYNMYDWSHMVPSREYIGRYGDKHRYCSYYYDAGSSVRF